MDKANAGDRREWFEPGGVGDICILCYLVCFCREQLWRDNMLCPIPDYIHCIHFVEQKKLITAG